MKWGLTTLIKSRIIIAEIETAGALTKLIVASQLKLIMKTPGQ